MRLFNFRKKKNAAGNLQSFSNVNAASLNIPVHADSEPFASDNDINNFTKAIGDEYVSKKQLELTKEDLEKISITDGAEMWRLYSWYHREVMPDDTDQKRKLSSQRINRLGAALAEKVLNADEIYCLYNKLTDQPHLFSRTVQQNDGYLCTPPDVRIFTKAYAYYALQKYPDDIFELKKIVRGADGKGIENFLGECFYLNGAQGIEIHSEYVSIDAAMLVPPPDFTGMNEINIPVMNPDLMRWMLLMAQMPKAETNDEELIYKLYYRFMSMEAVKAKFLVPMKLEENFPQSNKTEKIVLKSGAKFSIAVMKGKYDREAVIMYTDWKRLRECYNGWSGSIMTLSNIINNNDAVINPTNHPQLGFYIGKEMYEEMVTYTNK